MKLPGPKLMMGIQRKNRGAQTPKILDLDRWINLARFRHMGKASFRSGVDASKAREGSGWERLSLEEALGILDRMAKLPSVASFTCILQKCRKNKDLAHAKHVHAHICNYGLENHSAVGNYIVPMFVECGSLSDAQQVFNRLAHRNEHSWTSLILGYIQCGQLHHALKLYQEMLEDSVHPTSFTLVPLLRACAMLKDVERGREIHTEIVLNECDKHLFVGSTLVSMYAKCGSFLEAREVFAKLPVRDVVPWNALILGYAEYGPGQEALKCFEQMQLEGVSPNAVTFACILKACGNARCMDKIQELHMEIIQKGIEGYPLVGNTLVDVYVKHGSLSEAQEVLDKLPDRDVMSWNTLIAGYAEYGLGQEAFNCLEQMQLEGISPNGVILTCFLKVCCSMGAIDKGREIHIEITHKGFEGDLFVGSTLVGMYAKCGSLLEAWEVFAWMPVRDVVSWNALIAGYAENRPGQEVLKCFEQMQLEGISPNAVTFTFLLKAPCSMETIDQGREIHTEITRKGFERDPFVVSALVSMYAKGGSLSEAREIFDRLLVQDVVSWTALISGYAEHGPGHEALKCFEQMQLEGGPLDAVTFVSGLKACGSIGATVKGRQTHTQITQKGFERYLMVGNALTDMYAKCGSLLEAQDVFDRMPVQDVVSYNTLILGYAEHGFGQEAVKCFEQMQLKVISPDAVTFFFVLKACGSMGALDKGQEIHVEIIQTGTERDLSVANTLVDMYAKCDAFSEAKEVFVNLLVQDVLSWNGLIAGYAEHGHGEEALKCFGQMQLEGVSPDVVTFACVLKSCSNIGAIERGREIHIEIAQKEYERDLFVGSALVGMYAKCGSLAEAQEIFASLPVQDSMSWCALLGGYAEHGPGQEALKCFDQMQLEGISPDAGMFLCILKACSSIGAIDKGREIHMEIIGKGFERYPLVGNSLVDMYAKCGSISEAWEVFERLPVQDVVSWNAVIAGYAMNHEENIAQQCFEDMQTQGVKPDAVTFLCLLAACSQASLLSQGHKYFKVMREEYGITPKIEHYNCMADLFARSGHLCEAEKFLETIPCPLSEGSWRTVLGGCKTYGEAELGLRCFQQLVQINPEYASSYVLMADTYVSTGKWDDAYKLEKLRKHSRAKKKPARALTEVNNEVHEFVVGNNQSNEVLAMIEILSPRMKEEGHVPNLELVFRPISDEKEATSCEYAEKLAIAFGLFNMPQRQTLCVNENLRMCNESHCK